MPTARITEGELIEIAQRFRALEDQIERADAILAGRCREHSEASDTLEAKHTRGDLLTR